MRALLVGSIYHALRALAWPILRVVYRLTVHGLEHVPRRGGCILACNHVSFLDPAVLGVACPRRITFLAREPLFQEPWLGSFMRFMGAIPVDRHRTDVGLRHAVRMLRRGRVVTIFPEGGRQFSGRIGSAKPGVGLVAAKARVPVVPVLLRGTFEALPPGARWLRPAKIRVAFGPQIRYPDGRLSEHAYRQLAEQVTASWHHLMRESQ